MKSALKWVVALIVATIAVGFHSMNQNFKPLLFLCFGVRYLDSVKNAVQIFTFGCTMRLKSGFMLI